MKELLVLLAQLLATLAKLPEPGGARAVVAESILLKQQRERYTNRIVADWLQALILAMSLKAVRMRCTSAVSMSTWLSKVSLRPST